MTETRKIIQEVRTYARVYFRTLEAIAFIVLGYVVMTAILGKQIAVIDRTDVIIKSPVPVQALENK